ncbi:hypothetical protein NQ315_010144 [Exocentrus adspersus]|uniref:Protein kinase domain-containing protein n=1 Tax=Exocentrus adspersus TaxID=1586481 RepID=A0AAV8WBH4_9CUCU|nr:hypothetical protein NQ315_010144 [Exocentrus adspersus]
MSEAAAAAQPGTSTMKEDLHLLPKECEVYSLGQQIGAGSFSIVYKALDKKTNANLAIKSFRLKENDRHYYTRAATEIAFLKLLMHPHIIKYRCSDMTPQFTYLGIEYASHGSLKDYMLKNPNVPEATTQTVISQLLSALLYLHNKNVFHGDVKPENIMVLNEKVLRIKLSDFGLAEVLLKHHMVSIKSGSFYYMSPEIHLGFPVDCRSDLFSAGIVMYELLFKRKPFPTKISKEEYINLFRRRVEIEFPVEHVKYSRDCLSLVKNLLSLDKDRRLSSIYMLNHRFIHFEVLSDKQNHYHKASESFLSGIDLIEENKYGLGFIAITEAVLHLKIYMAKVNDVDHYKYVLMKVNEFSKYAKKVAEKLINEESTASFEMDAKNEIISEQLRGLLRPSPELFTAFDLCMVGEMYFKERAYKQGKDFLTRGLDIFMNKMKDEPDGKRKSLLGAKVGTYYSCMFKFGDIFFFT